MPEPRRPFAAASLASDVAVTLVSAEGFGGGDPRLVLEFSNVFDVTPAGTEPDFDVSGDLGIMNPLTVDYDEEFLILRGLTCNASSDQVGYNGGPPAIIADNGATLGFFNVGVPFP